MACWPFRVFAFSPLIFYRVKTRNREVENTKMRIRKRENAKYFSLRFRGFAAFSVRNADIY